MSRPAERKNALKAAPPSADVFAAQLTASIAHDFNNSLQGIVGALEMALLHLRREVPDQAYSSVEVALDTAVRAGGLTQRLLGLVHRQSRENPAASIQGALRPMRELLDRVLGGDISLVVESSEYLPSIACDASQLEGAILNLAINAREAMSGRGNLTIAIRLRDGAFVQAQGLEPGRRSDAYIEISVRDDGPGMSEHVLRHAVDPFFTTKPKGEGIGLGLTMVQDLVTQCGGVMAIQSKLEEGTTVTLYLPKAKMPGKAHRVSPLGVDPPDACTLIKDSSLEA
jgi:signal transduction histidine kinase